MRTARLKLGCSAPMASLAVAADRSIDLVFSFDSLVHAERDVIGGYLNEFARVLADDGVAFIHHSNTGAYEPGTYDPHNIHWRATTVSGMFLCWSPARPARSRW